MTDDLHTLTEKELLAEIVQELRCNTELLGNLLDETGDFHQTVKEDIWNRQPW